MKGRVLYVPEAAQGRLTFLGQEISIRPEDVAPEARRPGTRVRFDLSWEDEDFRASNVRRAWRGWGREPPTGQRRGVGLEVPSTTGPPALPASRGGDSMKGGSER